MMPPIGTVMFHMSNTSLNGSSTIGTVMPPVHSSGALCSILRYATFANCVAVLFMLRYAKHGISYQ